MTHSSSRSPSLRRTVLTMLMLGLLLLTAMQYLLAGNFFERQLQEIESKDAFARLRNLHHALEMLGEDLAATTTDWSQWDSAYDYTTHRYDAFATDNLSAGTIARLRLSFFIVIDQDGRPLFAKSTSADGTQLVDAPADIVRMASGTGVLSGSIEPLHHLTGLVATSSGVYLVSSQPVRTSMPGAPPRGRVVMGRSLNKFVAPALKRMTDEELEVQPVGADGLDDAADDEVYRRHDRDTLLVQGTYLGAVTPLDDLWGRPVAQLHTRMQRPTLAMLANAQGYLLVASLIVGLLFCVAGLVLVRSRVIVPLEQFAGAVGAIGEAGGVGARVPTQSSQELETLAQAINGMLHQLEQQQSMQSDRDAAVEANRLKSEFLATMSHEIRTPMNGVLGMCELLQRTELNLRQRHLSDTILRSARSLLEILNDILDFSKIESGRLELEHIGCRVTAVENGALALAAVAEKTFDAILMDCQMPVMDGHTATSELRALERAASQTPTFIIALTADATAENRRRCFDAGMDEVVTKPISQANLRDIIMQAVRPVRLQSKAVTFAG